MKRRVSILASVVFIASLIVGSGLREECVRNGEKISRRRAGVFDGSAEFRLNCGGGMSCSGQGTTTTGGDK